jgi:uncharacterized protein
MSQESVDIVRNVLAAWNRDDHESVLALLDPEVVFDASRRLINPKTHVGTKGRLQMLADRDEVWESFRTEPLEFIDAGDRVVVVGRWVGKGKGSGIEVDQPIAHIFTVHDRRVVRWELGYPGRREAREAVGLPE